LRRPLLVLLAVLIGLSPGTGYAQKKKKHGKKTAAQTDSSAEPDKVLYDRALQDIKRGRHEVGRLTLQTLINTYPDSEYLAKAKLSIADSFYKEAGTANLAQAISGYKDFIVFFPFLPEAAYAQLQVGMTHYKQLDKPDRDRTHARAAEDEFQTFLQKYPADPLVPKAEQRLREVQEILAEGDYRIGNFYYIKGSYRAAAARLMTVTNRYPLYSRVDRALWMLGTIFEKNERKDIAVNYYARIVRNYPLSGLTDDAKKRLSALNSPIPQPDPQALARMQQEQAADHRRAGIFHKATGILRSAPDVSMAATIGKPNLEPETASSGIDILKTGGGQNSVGGGGSTTAVVATVTPGSSNTGSASTGTPTEAESTGGAGSEAPAPEAGSNPQPDTATSGSDASSGGASGAQPANPSATSPATDAKGAPPAANQANAQGGDTKSADAKNAAADKKKESTSKKKKGLRKIIPW
jgi:outer membrane protein assembly factor BamD